MPKAKQGMLWRVVLPLMLGGVVFVLLLGCLGLLFFCFVGITAPGVLNTYTDWKTIVMDDGSSAEMPGNPKEERATQQTKGGPYQRFEALFDNGNVVFLFMHDLNPRLKPDSRRTELDDYPDILTSIVKKRGA